MPSEFQAFLEKKLDKHHQDFVILAGLIQKWVYNLDIYYDSCPRGSCNTIFEAIEAKVPVLLVDTEFNRESSALPYLRLLLISVWST